MNMGTGACSICHPDHKARSDGDTAQKRWRYFGGCDLDRGFDEAAGLGEIAGSYVWQATYLCTSLSEGRVGGFGKEPDLRLPSLGIRSSRHMNAEGKREEMNDPRYFYRR